MPEQELHHVTMLYHVVSKVFKSNQQFKRLEKLWKILDDVNGVYLC